MQNTDYSPPRPDLPNPASPSFVTLEPVRRKVWPWIIAGAIGMFLVLGAIGVATGANDPPTTLPTPVVTDTGDSGLTLDEAYSQATPLMNQVADELTAITATSAVSSDVIHLNRAADLMDQAAAMFVGVDDAEGGYLSSAGDHFRAAAIAEDAGDSVTFQQEIQAATSDIDAARALVS